ncbi:MAG: hypothetical protein NTU44_00340, partial [Bacteroidetes bacterium]|nr:hypothetical protein [Bacteroidota bacterium]
MKHILLFTGIVLLSSAAFSQGNPPVALADTFQVYLLDDTLSINVINNDYDPDGDAFRVISATGAVSHTDSTVSVAFPYDFYHKFSGVIPFGSYTIYDSVHQESGTAVLYANCHNNFFNTLDINKVSARINNNGNHFWNLKDTPQYYIPKGTMKTALSSFSFWIGGMDVNDQLHLAADRYGSRGQDFWPGPATNGAFYNNIFDSTWNKVWKVSRSEIEYHQSHWWLAGYTPRQSILTWPGNGDPAKGQSALLAPFIDMNNNGIYEPILGDFPLIRGDQTVFFILNDTRRLHTETNGLSLGLEIQGMAYAFDCPSDSALQYTTFLHYDIFNRSTYTYFDAFLGAFVDVNLGHPSDDYLGCDVGRGSFYCYNGNEIDGSGEPEAYGAFPPAISVTILGGPYLEADNLDNPDTNFSGNPLCDYSINGLNFGDRVPDNERFGMTAFTYTNNCSIGPTCDPSNATEYFHLMQGIWKDDVHMQYGGNGHPNSGATGPDCRFMFPGLTDSCNWGTDGIQPIGYQTGAGGSGNIWTEAQAGIPPGDRRGIVSMGPFTFQPGVKQELDIAFVWARQYTDSSATAVIPLLQSCIDQIRSYFVNDSIPCGGSFQGIQSLN